MVDNKESKLLKYIALTQMKSLGPATQNTLLDICGNIGSCFEASYDELINAYDTQSIKRKRIGKSRIESFVEQREDKNLWNRAEEILRLSEASEIIVIVREDMEYPDRFRNIKDMPLLLYTKGKLRINEFNHSMGIVGARRCTTEGKEKAIDIATKAASVNKAVISGMAKGIDSYAHTAVLKSHGYTIAVLGNGADICYPKEHGRLYEEIIRQGCVLSEYPPGTLPREYNFPKRNRLIAALSDRLYVIDAGRNSGTLSTMENSKKYKKEVVMLGEEMFKLNED